jgi:hypothetical protein
LARQQTSAPVEVVKVADLVILADDIRNTERIAGVVTVGRCLDRQELDRLLSEAVFFPTTESEKKQGR